jgi:hypothetical protein
MSVHIHYRSLQYTLTSTVLAIVVYKRPILKSYLYLQFIKKLISFNSSLSFPCIGYLLKVGNYNPWWSRGLLHTSVNFNH